jgi:hypothetical protein
LRCSRHANRNAFFVPESVNYVNELFDIIRFIIIHSRRAVCQTRVSRSQSLSVKTCALCHEQLQYDVNLFLRAGSTESPKAAVQCV